MDFSISEMDLSICAPQNNHINYIIIIIINFVNLSLKENVIISVFILKVPILQPYGNNSTSGVFFFANCFCLWPKWPSSVGRCGKSGQLSEGIFSS
jgi:hypothetical protein